MNRNEIKARLGKLPVEASIALAIRVGLRVLPWLALSKTEEVLIRWPEEDRANHTLAICLAYDAGLLGVLERQAVGLKHTATSRYEGADSAYSAYDAAVNTYFVFTAPAHADNCDNTTCAAAAYAATAVAAYIAKGTAAAASIIDDSDSHENCSFHGVAITAAADATDAAYAAYAAHNILPDFNLNLNNDFKILSNGCTKTLIETPLWLYAPPILWVQQFAHFQAALYALDKNFDFWLSWYEARCKGESINVELLKRRVFLSESITSKSTETINAYLSSLRQGLTTAPLNRVRTIFIGDGEAGKTSLIRVLHSEPVVEGIEPRTPGIEIREWKIPETDITASFWDFGGQVMVHATHQLFLRESCLYVLLVSAREKEKATERAEYWLEHVKSYGKGAPVLIVANKADKEPVRLNESLLMEKYPGMISGFFQLSCTDATDRFRYQFEQFRQAFCHQLQAVGLHQVRFMKPHFAVLQNLRKRTPSQAFLTHRDYNALCDKQEVDSYGALDRHWLLDILDKLGIIVHFPDMIEMDEYILNPRWLTYGVYTLMYNEQAHITRRQAVSLLAAKPVTDQYGNKLRYPASKCRIVFEAMRKYKLCYFLPSDPNQIIIPALLPSDIKQHGFDTNSALEFHYQFESFLPRHLISELIVECHTDIASRDDQQIVWQHGVLLDNATHETRALIQADYHFRRLSIWLSRGPRMADMLAALRDRIEKIVERIDIDYEQKVRLPKEALLNTARKDDGKPAMADFLQLREMLANNQNTFFHKSGSQYSISKVLGMFEPQPESSTKGSVTNVKIVGSTIIGDVTAVSKIDDSFNSEPQSPKID